MPFLLARARPEERRPLVAVLVTIALVLIAHAILETARDAVFLTHVPASHLPWLYLALAGLIILTRPILGLAGSKPSRGSLVALQTAAALGTAAFAFADTDTSVAVFYALYLWGGIAGMMILVRLWLLLSARFTASQAKRLFPYVASSAVLGGLIGYGGAGLLSARFTAHGLLAVSAAVFLLSALSSLWWPPASAVIDAQAADDSGSTGRPTPPPPMRLMESLTTLARHSYVRRVAAMMLLASVAVTLVDFTFKSAVSESVATGHLTTFLATSYFLFDLASLLLLGTVVGPLLRRVGVARALTVRPALLIGAGAALAAFGGLWPVLLLRGVDGMLRASLHKTAAELLYVPMSARLRTAVKEISDVVAHRGGQALGSLIILVWLAVIDNDRWMGPVIIVCAGAWIALASSLRAPYLNLFRDMLGSAASDTQLEFPELDIASLEATIAALSSPDDGRVLAALDLLAESGRTHLIPALILYHPAPAVILRTLEHGAAAARGDFMPFCSRLLSHQDGAVRGAAMRMLARIRPDRERLSTASAASCPIVATTALIACAKHGWIEPDAAHAQVTQRLSDPADGAAARPCVARALRDWPLPSFAPLLAELAKTDDVVTQCEALHAIGALRHDSHLALVVRLLGEHDLRPAARAALLAYGDVALDHLTAAWDDPALPRAVRIHLPRTVSRFPAPRAADLLLERLLVEPSGMVRYKILRGLGRLVADNPEMQLDSAVLDRIIERHLTNTLQLLHRRSILESHPVEGALAHGLLVELMRQKEAFAIQRLFRVLGLRYREEDFGRVFAGLRSADAETRSSSRELIEHGLPPTLAAAVVGLIDDVADDARLASGRAYYEPQEIAYDALIVALIAEPSPVVSALAAHHGGEIGLDRDDRPVPDPTARVDRLIAERRPASLARVE